MTTDNINGLDTEPWYKQGWPWVLIAIPFLTVIAGVTTFMYAVNTSDSLVVDDYYKEGMAINRNIERVNHAKSLAIVAEITLDEQAKILTVKLSSKQELPDNLSLNFSHPTLEKNDQFYSLSRLTGNEYVTELIPLKNSYWHVILEDEDKTWLVKSRWLYPENTSLTINTNAL